MRWPRSRYFWITVILVGLGLAFFLIDWNLGGEEVIEYHVPPPAPDEWLADDLLSQKNPAFVADLVDRRPEGEWQINSSAAVLRIDAPMLKPDADAELLTLRPSYADAISKKPGWSTLLPSINMIDGKAKQFDDGLYAAIDLAYYRGQKPKLESLVTFIKHLRERVPSSSPAFDYLTAGLSLANAEDPANRPAGVVPWLNRFEAAAMYSKPFSFYTWTPELTQVFRFIRYFQQPLPSVQPNVVIDLAKAVRNDPELLKEYQRINTFYAGLTNPLINHSLTDAPLSEGKPPTDDRPIAVFPTSGSKEETLFGRLFPHGLPPDADLMKAMIQAIRLGKVNLAPTKDSGWYEHQVYALETFLLPENGDEYPKLLLTKAYKKRMLEAFQAVITKRRETHARDLAAKSAEALQPVPPATIKPRLRVEPCPSFYLRTARSYDFLLAFLTATAGEDGLAALHGFRAGGERPKTLLEELRWMREFFYGLHLLSSEDIGMVPGLRTDEPVDRTACEAKAAGWLSHYDQDLDLRVDMRVSVPIYFDASRQRTRLWATLGVRLALLEVSHAKGPRIRPLKNKGDWQDVQPDQLQGINYVIAVDEFTEAEIPGLLPLTREEFHKVCDVNKTKAEIVRALSRWKR